MPHDFKKFPELTNSQMDFYYFDSPHEQIFEMFEAKVVDVHDGDTIRLQTDFRNFTFPLRFLDIAAPELNEEGGKESQQWLSNQILGLEVMVEIEPKNRVGKYGRLLGRIISQGININEFSINEGMSVPFDQRKDQMISEPNFGGEF